MSPSGCPISLLSQWCALWFIERLTPSRIFYTNSIPLLSVRATRQSTQNPDTLYFDSGSPTYNEQLSDLREDQHNTVVYMKIYTTQWSIWRSTQYSDLYEDKIRFTRFKHVYPYLNNNDPRNAMPSWQWRASPFYEQGGWVWYFLNIVTILTTKICTFFSQNWLPYPSHCWKRSPSCDHQVRISWNDTERTRYREIDHALFFVVLCDLSRRYLIKVYVRLRYAWPHHNDQALIGYARHTGPTYVGGSNRRSTLPRSNPWFARCHKKCDKRRLRSHRVFFYWKHPNRHPFVKWNTARSGGVKPTHLLHFYIYPELLNEAERREEDHVITGKRAKQQKDLILKLKHERRALEVSHVLVTCSWRANQDAVVRRDLSAKLVVAPTPWHGLTTVVTLRLFRITAPRQQGRLLKQA